ncbi:MAG: pentapeptide repeat-containing protein, partial [Sandaracinaceae bacterium]|nr:pentapeptide repeat-containing protein [Sandaracinaceae bacterium]
MIELRTVQELMLALGPERVLRGARIAGLRARQIDLTNVVLADVVLEDVHLRRCDLSGMRWQNVRFTSGSITACRWDGGALDDCVIGGLPGGGEGGIDLSGTSFAGASLEDIDLRRALLAGVRLERANLSRASLAGVELAGVMAPGVILRDARLA